MVSTSRPERAYVWVWLPGRTDPVPAGVIRRSGPLFRFAYGNRYLERPDAISIYEPELPLRSGWIEPRGALPIASALRDAGPDSWGQRVILARLRGRTGRDADTSDLDQLTYFLESGSNRVGALDFQSDPDSHVPRGEETVTLDDMAAGADRLARGDRIGPALDAALLRGTSIGGARPKAVLRDGQRELIAKFTTSSDVWPEVGAETAALILARNIGINVPLSDTIQAMGRRALLVERFDRPADGSRRILVSGLTMLELAEYEARYATYPDLLDKLAAHGADPHVGRKLFERIVFNIAIGNNDDHARNHAAFWNGQELELTPAYDLTPQVRSGETSFQAMAIGRQGERESSFLAAVRCCSIYGLTTAQARQVVEFQTQEINSGWADAADEAHLSEADRRILFRRAILNPSVWYGYSRRT